MEQLEPDTEDEIIDITDYTERPPNDKRSLQHVPKYGPHSVTQGPCPTPQTRPSLLSYECDDSTCKAPSYGNLGNPPGQKNTMWMAHMFKETTTQGSL